MRVNIKKLAGGGFATSTFYVDSEPTSAASPGAATAAADNSEKKISSSILDENTFKELLTKGGLVNDVNNLVNELVQLEANNNNPFLSEENRGQALRMIAKVNELRQNKNLWDDAMTAAKSSGGLSEVAIGTSGEVYTKDSNNKVKVISIQNYLKNKDNIKLLTVAELLNERQYNPQLTGQNSIFEVAHNAMGIDKITEHVKDLIKALGTEESTSSQFYSKDQAKTYLQGLNIKSPNANEKEAIATLQQIISSPGEYSQVEVLKSSQRQHLDKALNYIWDTLGTSAKQKLTITAGINGEDPKKLLFDMLESQTSVSVKNTVTPKELPGQTASDKTANASKTVSLSPQELFHGDRLYQPGMTYEINNPTAGVSLKATATGIAPLFSLLKAGEVIGPKTVSSLMSESNFMSILNPSKAFIGDTKIDPMLLKEAAYTGEEVAKVYLPIRPDGSPDLGQMEAFSKAYEVFNANKNVWTIDQIKTHFKRAGFNNINIQESQDADGSITRVIGENNKVKPFLALPIISNSASNISSNPWMVEVEGSRQASDEMLMENAFSIIGGTSSKPKITNTMPSKFFSLETPYRGTMFLAYRPEANAIISSMNGHLTGKTPTEVDLYRNLNYSNAANNPSGITASARYLHN